MFQIQLTEMAGEHGSHPCSLHVGCPCLCRVITWKILNGFFATVSMGRARTDWIAESYSSRCSSDWCTSLQSRVWQFWQVLSLFCIDWIFTHNTMLVLHYCTGCMFQLWANIFPEEYITSNNIICIKSLKAVYTNAVTYFCFKAETIKMPYFIWL